jgi:phage terminase small subunit
MTHGTAKLTPKQQRFVEEYLIDMNGTQAAIRAGYSERTACEQASRLLANVKIQEAVALARTIVSEKAGITVERVLREMGRLAFVDVRKLYDADGRLLSIHDIDDETAAAISSIEVDQLFDDEEPDESLEGQPHGGALKRSRSGNILGKTSKVKLLDKKGALESLMKHLGLYKDGATVINNIYLPEQDRALLDEYAKGK